MSQMPAFLEDFASLQRPAPDQRRSASLRRAEEMRRFRQRARDRRQQELVAQNEQRRATERANSPIRGELLRQIVDFRQSNDPSVPLPEQVQAQRAELMEAEGLNLPVETLRLQRAANEIQLDQGRANVGLTQSQAFNQQVTPITQLLGQRAEAQATQNIGQLEAQQAAADRQVDLREQDLEREQFIADIQQRVLDRQAGLEEARLGQRPQLVPATVTQSRDELGATSSQVVSPPGVVTVENGQPVFVPLDALDVSSPSGTAEQRSQRQPRQPQQAQQQPLSQVEEAAVKELMETGLTRQQALQMLRAQS